MFKDRLLSLPNGQKYAWLAESYGSYLSEFDLYTWEENSFYDIDKESLVRFGLIGNEQRFWFECSRGTFNLLGKRIDIRYRDGDTVYELTNQNVYQRDIITFKKAYSEANVSFPGKDRKLMDVHILSYSFGYKSSMNIEGVQFNFKPIVTLPHEEREDFTVTIDMSANKDMENGKIELVNSGKVIDSFDAPLKKSETMRLYWKMK